MNRHLIPLLLLGLASMTNAELIQSPRTDLELVEGNFRFATNFLARGMFREAEVMIDIASRTATGRLNEYDAGEKAAGSESERYAPRFREYVELLKEERAKLEAERAKPLDVERALSIVLDRVSEMLRSPEFSRMVADDVDSAPAEVRHEFENVTEFWSGLFPAEKWRLLKTLVESVTVLPDEIAIKVRTKGVALIMEELRNAR